MKMKKLLLFAALLAVAAAASAQYTVDNRRAVAEFEKGVQLLGADPDRAFAHFRKALKAEPAFAEVRLTMADWYLDHDSLDQARTHYSAYLRQHSGSGARWAAAALRGLQTAEFRLNAMAHPVPFSPQNLGPAVNSTDDEYMPTLSADGRTLLFTRRFPRTPKSRTNSAEEEDFYFCRLGDDGWEPAQRMEEPVNSFDNEGSGCLSQDGRMLFFTACGRDDGAGRCDIYVCYRRGSGWSRPRNLGPAVNTGSWESQPCLSIDGRTLYFVSDRRGGYGGMDLWQSTLVEGRWQPAVNLGPAVNTAGDERCPFISFDNQTLFFSSNGHIGMGDMDIFFSRRVGDSAWSEPQNLGYPINTSGDEGSLLVSPDGRTAYFSTDRLGGMGRLDLYSFALPESARPHPVAYREEIIDLAPEMPVGESVTLNNVFFQTGKYALLDISVVELDKVVEMLSAHPSMRIELEGHTDNVGRDDMNQRLSEQRAKAVYDYLVGRGIDPARLAYRGYGPTRPVGDNATAEGRRLNRRTAFTIIEK